MMFMPAPFAPAGYFDTATAVLPQKKAAVVVLMNHDPFQGAVNDEQLSTARHRGGVSRIRFVPVFCCHDAMPLSLS
jgi:hypothetical protein